MTESNEYQTTILETLKDITKKLNSMPFHITQALVECDNIRNHIYDLPYGATPDLLLKSTLEYLINQIYNITKLTWELETCEDMMLSPCGWDVEHLDNRDEYMVVEKT
jgi:hypothetical protein